MLTAWGREKIWMLLGEKEAAVFRVTWCGTRLTDELKTDSRDDISCHSAVCWWWAAATRTRTKAAVLAPSRSTSQSDSHCVALVSSSEPVPGYRTTEDKSWDICRNKMLHSKTLSLKGLFCGNQTPPRRQKAFTAFRVTHKKKSAWNDGTECTTSTRHCCSKSRSEEGRLSFCQPESNVRAEAFATSHKVTVLRVQCDLLHAGQDNVLKLSSTTENNQCWLNQWHGDEQADKESDILWDINVFNWRLRDMKHNKPIPSVMQPVTTWLDHIVFVFLCLFLLVHRAEQGAHSHMLKWARRIRLHH